VKHGYFSKTMANQKWLICPQWQNHSAGKIYDVVFVINDLVQDDYIRNFVNNNKELYPDLIYLGELELCVVPGIPS
jgi:hypothetical protein